MSTLSNPLQAEGLVLGRYRPLRPLRAGGSGTVWLARDETSGLEVALKIIAKEGRAAPRAEREAGGGDPSAPSSLPPRIRAGVDDKHLYIPYESTCRE